MPSNAISVVHKYIRREMFDFAQQLFRAGPEDIGSIRAALGALGELLQAHAAQEDARLKPLLAQFDGALAQRLDREHRRLHDFFDGLVLATDALDPAHADCPEALHRLQLDWNRFLSEYLMHLDEEERTLFAHIADRLPPVASLIQSARRQGPRGEEFVLRLWAVTTCSERVELEKASAAT